MIFKTFHNDIDKWTAKIGIFGKSFNELGTAVNNAFESVINNIDNLDENIGFWESLKKNLFSNEGADKDWIKNSFDDIVSKENIDSYIEQLDLDTAKDKLLNLFNWDKKIKDNKKSWQDYFSTLDDGENYIIDLIENTDDLSKLTGEDLVNACNDARNAAIAHNQEIKNMSLSAKAGQVVLKGLAIAGNMIAMWAISKGIELAVKGIDKLIHSAEYAEQAFKDATDSAKSFSDAIKDIQKDTVNMESSVNSIIDRYAELSQGVNPFTNENKSLPTEKYEEFLDLNKQLAGLFPSLTRNYDKNGQAILGLSGSVDSVTESIRALVEQEKELGQAKIRENIEGYFNGTNDADGAWKALEGRKKSVEEINEELNSLTDTYNTLINSDEKIKIGSTFKNWARSEGKKYIDYIKNTFGIDISDAIDIEYGKGLFGDIADVFVDFSKLELDETQKEQITKSYDTFYSELLARQKTAISEFESQNSDISNNALFWLEDLDFYKDSNIYVQTAMQNLVRSIDWSNYDPEQLDYDGVKRILQDSILTPFQTACDDPTVKKSLEDALVGLYALNLSDMSVNNIDPYIIDSYIDTIATILNKNRAELKVQLGFEKADDTIKDIKNRLNNRILQLLDDKYVLTDPYGAGLFISADGLESEEYASWLKVIESLKYEQADLFLETIDGAESVSQALEMWNTKLYDIKKADNQLLSLSETIDQLNTKIKPAFDSLESAWKNIFTEDGFALNNIDILSTCNSIKSKLDELNKIDGITVDYSSYEDFVRVLRNSESTEKEVQDAFDALATSITQVGLSGKEDFETMRAALEDLGVINNEIVAFDALINNTGALKEAGLDLVNATEEDITDFVNKMMVSAENAAQAVNMLTFQKELFNLQEMNSGREVEHLRKLAENAGYTGAAIQYLTELELIYSRVARGYYGTEGPLLDEKLERAKQLTQLITESSFKVDFDVEKESAGSAGKDAAKSFTDALDKELTALDKKMEAGYIDFNDYIQARLKLIEAYYKQGKLSADEYYSYLEKHYDTQLSYMDKVVSAVTRRIDTEIDALKQQKKDVESLYAVQIESLEKQKTLLEEANQERQRQINLQKAQYDLERARNQRTKLVYSEDKGMHFVADEQSISDAQKSADDAKYENQIAEIEKSISKLENARDQETSAIDAMISNLEEYKDAWSDVTSTYKEEQEDLLAAQFFGADWESKILNGRLDVLKDFKEQYIRIQQEIAAAAAQETVNGQVGATGKDNSGSEGDQKKKKKALETLKTPIQRFSSSLASSLTSSLPTQNQSILSHIQTYGSGTNNAKKGLNLVGEDGAEAYFDNHGHVAIVTKPTLIPMEGGEVVKNERDTKELLDLENLAPADTIGLADIDEKEARYTIKVDVEAETFTLSDGTVLTPLQPGNPIWDMQQKLNSYINGMGNDISSVTAPISTIQRDMESMVNRLSTVNNISNNGKHPVTIGDIHVTCPGVTSQEVAKQVGVELNRQFRGLSLVALQESKK